MTIQMVSALMAAPVLKDREHNVAIVIANHAGECPWHGGEQAAFPSIDLIAMEARVSRRTAIRAVATMCALGVMRKIKGTGQASNQYLPNEPWIEAMARQFSDLRRALRREHGPNGWLDPMLEHVAAVRERLYRRGVEAKHTPEGWPQVTAQERERMIAQTLSDGHHASRKRDKVSSANASLQKPVSSVENDVENSASSANAAPQQEGVCSAADGISSAALTRSGAAIASPKPLEPSKTLNAREDRTDLACADPDPPPQREQPETDPDENRTDGLGEEAMGDPPEREAPEVSTGEIGPNTDDPPPGSDPPKRARPNERLKPGEGALDDRGQQPFEIATIHWMRTGDWAAPPGYTGQMGPAPDDPQAERGFGLGPRLLSGLVIGLIKSCREHGRHFIRGPSGALAGYLLRDAQSPDDGVRHAVLERMALVEDLAGKVRKARDLHQWEPPPPPKAAAESEE